MKYILQWVGGEHPFALDIGNIRALQNACDAGPEQILRDLTGKTWKIEHIYQTIRLGLIGGGMAEPEAKRLVDTMFQSHPLLRFKLTAQAILIAALMGDPDDPLGEAKGETAPRANGGSASSTEPVQL